MTSRDAVVHLHLRPGSDDDAVGGLRQRLVDCLAAGVREVRVHLDGDDVELPVLRALDAAGTHLAERGGTLVLLGVNPRVRRRVVLYALDGLLPEPYPSEDDVVAPERRTAPPR